MNFLVVILFNFFNLPVLPLFVLEQQGTHNATMLSQLWVLNHLVPVGRLICHTDTLLVGLCGQSAPL